MHSAITDGTAVVGAGLIARKTIEGLEAGQGGGIFGQLAEVLKGQKKNVKDDEEWCQHARQRLFRQRLSERWL